MREQWAKRIVLITGLLVLLLAFLFAGLQNTLKTTVITENSGHRVSELDPKQIETGRQVYQQQSCALCHSIAGQGNPRNPLDNVGEKHSPEALRDYIIGADGLQNILPEYSLKLKQRYQLLPPDELNALIIYLRSLGS